MKTPILILSFFYFCSNIFASGDDLFTNKMAGSEIKGTVSRGWYDARLITFGAYIYVKERNSFHLTALSSDLYSSSSSSSSSSSEHLYEKNSSPNHVVLRSERTIGVSADKNMRNEKKRMSKDTAVHYDKYNIIQNDKDFLVDSFSPEKHKIAEDPKTNYDGGHLVDYIFGNIISNSDSNNYVPQHYFYNQFLKKYIVNQKIVDGYLEIPLFTPNPPKIKVVDKEKYDSIPIGILLATLRENSLQDVYYFPNNKFNYRDFQKSFKIEKQPAINISKKFKLKNIFHHLLWPAVIYPALPKLQEYQESTGLENITPILEGMMDRDSTPLKNLVFNVVHHKKVDLKNLLEDERILDQEDQNFPHLTQSFDILGNFLVSYAINNVLKSEVISIASHTMFVDLIISCIEEMPIDVSAETVFDYFDEEYPNLLENILQKLWKTRDLMTLENKINHARIYQKLSADGFIDSGIFNLPVFKYGIDSITGESVLKHNLLIINDCAESHFYTLCKLIDEIGQQIKSEEYTNDLKDLLNDALESYNYVLEKTGGDKAGDWNEQKNLLDNFLEEFFPSNESESEEENSDA